MSSQSSNTASQPLAIPLLPNMNSEIATSSSASVAQTVDRLVQDLGLTDNSRQSLHLFAIQTNPLPDALWLFALTLSNAQLMNQVLLQYRNIEREVILTQGSVNQAWRPTSNQVAAIKSVQRHILVVGTTTSYRDGKNRVKQYLGYHQAQFGLENYPGDHHIAVIINDIIDRDAHQARGSFRKLIFAAAVGTRPLDVVARKIGILYSTTITTTTPLPTAYKAHIAQLRLIAYGIINASVRTNQGGVPTGTRRPRNDTGFWTAVDAEFNRLVGLHGNDYDNGAGWRLWETEMIEQDEVRYNGHTDLFDQAVIELYAPGVYNN